MKFIGEKKGMTQIFDKDKKFVACSVIYLEPQVVVQIKTKEKDGYSALQMGAILKNKNVKKPQINHFKKAETEPCKYLAETRFEDESKLLDYKIGQKVEATYFTEGDEVDVSGISKGKGFQGVMKIYGMKGGPASHGSRFHRHQGSCGAGRSTTGRCFPNTKRPRRLGQDNCTIQNLKVVAIDAENNTIAISGAIPGGKNSRVIIRKRKNG